MPWRSPRRTPAPERQGWIAWMLLGSALAGSSVGTLCAIGAALSGCTDPALSVGDVVFRRSVIEFDHQVDVSPCPLPLGELELVNQGVRTAGFRLKSKPDAIAVRPDSGAIPVGFSQSLEISFDCSTRADVSGEIVVEILEPDDKILGEGVVQVEGNVVTR